MPRIFPLIHPLYADCVKPQPTSTLILYRIKANNDVAQKIAESHLSLTIDVKEYTDVS